MNGRIPEQPNDYVKVVENKQAQITSTFVVSATELYFEIQETNKLLRQWITITSALFVVNTGLLATFLWVIANA